MYVFLCQIVWNILKFILFIGRIEAFWFTDVIDIWLSANFEYKTHKSFMYQIISNIFKNKFWDKCPEKLEKKEFWTNHKYFWTKFCNTFKFYTIKKLLSKNQFYFFFASSDMQKFYTFLGCHAIGINSSNTFF